jgi:hypothetical protein
MESHVWIIEYKSPGLPLVEYTSNCIVSHYKCSSCRMRATKTITRNGLISTRKANSFMLSSQSYNAGICEVGEIIPEAKGMSCKDWIFKSVLL